MAVQSLQPSIPAALDDRYGEGKSSTAISALRSKADIELSTAKSAYRQERMLVRSVQLVDLRLAFLSG